MLRFVSIENFALIQRVQIEFQAGLNLITGETGSGKSILVDAVGLLTGARASQEMVRQGHETARIEGLFELPPDSVVREVLRDNGFEDPEPELVIRREISLGGANRVFINDRLSTLGVLALIGRHLVDIHGQHNQQTLLNPGSHLEMIDWYGGLGSAREKVAQLFSRISDLRGRVKSIRESEKDRLQRLDLLKYQRQEIGALNLSVGLDDELAAERLLLSSAESRLEAAQEAYQFLYEDDEAVVARLDRIGRRLEQLAELDTAQTELPKRLQEAQFLIEEVSFQVRDYLGDVQFDPRRLEEIEERLAEIDRAKRKYGATIEDVLEFAADADREIERLEDSEQEMGRLDGELASATGEYECLATELSRRRQDASKTLCDAVQRELADLAMRSTVLEARFEASRSDFTEKGIDEVEFLISPNPGEEPRPLARIASGGELSRLMLALKSVSRDEDRPKTLVFDEVDAGIGGRTATVLGAKLARVAQRHQVFCVTHLPQIAAFAHQHFHVGKSLRDDRTVVGVHRLDEEGRVEELARMLAGERITETSRRQAEELLKSGRDLIPQ
jgi:DNA repair protein RecN (Recombination protein N)